MRLCDDNENPSYLFNTFIGPLAVILLICSFASAVALHFLCYHELMYKFSKVICCNNPISTSWVTANKTTAERVWKEQPVFRYIKERKLGMVCLLHLFGAGCEVFDASGNLALTILSQRIDDDEINFEHSSAFVKWYCISILGLYQNAVKHNYFKCVTTLLESKADINSIIDERGSTIAHLAVHQGCLEKVKFLLDAKADVNSKDVRFQTPINLATKIGHLEIVQLLIEKGGNVNDEAEDGMTPLHCAAYFGHFEIAKLLIEKGANINAKIKDAHTPLHFAAQVGHLEIVQLLLEKGANINEKEDNGKTPLHCAAEFGHFDVVQLLIEKGANPMDRTKDGLSALGVMKKNKENIETEEIRKCESFLLSSGVQN